MRQADDRAQIGEARPPAGRARLGAVGDASATPGFGVEQRTEYAARRAARAEDQDPGGPAMSSPRLPRGPPSGRRRRCCRRAGNVAKAMVLTACARAARGVSSLTSSAAACLWGSVTFKPCTPLGEEARSASRRKSSGGDVEQPVDQVLRGLPWRTCRE